MPTNGGEKTGYPNQKPEGILRRLLTASSAPGTTGAVAAQLGRRFVMVDGNPDAIAVMRRRLGRHAVEYVDDAGDPIPSCVS